MVRSKVRAILNTLAHNYIPQGTHKLLHVDSRATWIDLMEGLLESGALDQSLRTMQSCAKSWEYMIATRISLLN